MNNEEKRRLLAVYYDIRKTNIDIYGSEEKRFHRPIEYRESLEDLTPSRILNCLREESDMVRTAALHDNLGKLPPKRNRRR